MNAVTRRRRLGNGSLPAHAVEALQGLAQHRVLSTPQLHELHMPGTAPRWAQDVTHELATLGLAQAVPMRGTRIGVHFLTQAGHATVAEGRLADDRKPKVVTPAGAAGGLQAHTLDVNTVGVAFCKAARERGDEMGPFGWRHEVAHVIGAGGGRGAKGGDIVTSDALLDYTLERGDRGFRMLTRFIEVDRSTYPTMVLVEKLRKYAQLHQYVGDGEMEPGWRRQYPAAFPHILVVFTGKPRRELERRMDRVLGACTVDPQIQVATGPSDHRTGFVIACTLLQDLIALRRRTPKGPLVYEFPDGGGPFGSVFMRHDMPGGYVNWLGQPAR